MIDKDEMLEILQFAMGCKAKMIARGSTRAKRTCPKCGGRVNLALAGQKNHIHMACETDGCWRMME